MDDAGLQSIEKQIGTLIMGLDGSVLASSGVLEDKPQTAETLYRALQDTNAVISASEKPSAFKRLTISFSDYSYRITIAKQKVYVVVVGTK